MNCITFEDFKQFLLFILVCGVLGFIQGFIFWYIDKKLARKKCAKLKCFEDAWSALSLFTDLIQKMGEVDSELIQEEDFCKLLDECGFKDLKAYKDPYVGVEIPKEDMVEISLPKAKAKKLGLLK